MTLKVVSVNFVKEAEVPASKRNTGMGMLLNSAIAALQKTPGGQAAKITVEGMGKHTRMGLGQRLRALEVKGADGKVRTPYADVKVKQEGSTLFLVREKE